MRRHRVVSRVRRTPSRGRCGTWACTIPCCSYRAKPGVLRLGADRADAAVRRAVHEAAERHPPAPHPSGHPPRHVRGGASGPQRKAVAPDFAKTKNVRSRHTLFPSYTLQAISHGPLSASQPLLAAEDVIATMCHIVREPGARRHRPPSGGLQGHVAGDATAARHGHGGAGPGPASRSANTSTAPVRCWPNMVDAVDAGSRAPANRAFVPRVAGGGYRGRAGPTGVEESVGDCLLRVGRK